MFVPLCMTIFVNKNTNAGITLDITLTGSEDYLIFEFWQKL